MVEKKYSAPALEKGLDIIEVLSWEDAGLTQAEIARALDRSVSEIFRMLSVLVDRGYIAQNPISDRYQLTSLIFEIAHRTPVLKRLTAIALPVMSKLANEINQSVHLAVVSGNSALIVAQKDSPGVNILSVKLGARIDVWQASSGWVFLANRPQEEVEKIIEETGLPRDMTKDALMKRLSDIRAHGHETHPSFRMRGVTNISTPVLDHTGFAVAALTVPYIERIDGDLTLNFVETAICRAAENLSKQIGSGNGET